MMDIIGFEMENYAGMSVLVSVVVMGLYFFPLMMKFVLLT